MESFKENPTIENLPNGLLDIIKQIQSLSNQIAELKEHFQPKEPNKYLTRKQLAKMFSADPSTIHNWTVKGILKAHQIGGRVVYKLSEVEEAIVELKK